MLKGQNRPSLIPMLCPSLFISPTHYNPCSQLSLLLSLSYTVSQSFSLTLTMYLSNSLSDIVSFSISLYQYITPSFCHTLCISPSLFVSLPVYLSLSLAHSLSTSSSLHLCLLFLAICPSSPSLFPLLYLPRSCYPPLSSSPNIGLSHSQNVSFAYSLSHYILLTVPL